MNVFVLEKYFRRFLHNKYNHVSKIYMVLMQDVFDLDTLYDTMSFGGWPDDRMVDDNISKQLNSFSRLKESQSMIQPPMKMFLGSPRL